MSSPIPPDPYEALGVPKDADISAVRTAHRKLALKHHPDRISDPSLKEKGKDLFTKIQQAYELLSDPVRRARYDDKIKLAELRKEAMMRDSPRTYTYPTRPAGHSASSSREWNTDEQAFYETRRPREPEFDSKERFEPPNRNAARKHPDYDRASSNKKPEKTERSAKAAWGVAAEAVKFGIRVKKDAEKSKSSKSHQSKQETRDREKRQARMEKDRRAYVVDPADSDSDAATHVTASTVRPSKSVPRHSPSSTRSSATYQRRAFTDDDDSDTATLASMKWERGHYEGAKDYIEQATAASGQHRPSIGRGDSFWGTKKSGSDSEKRPPSSRGRQSNSYDDFPPRPSMPTQNSAPNNLRTRVDDRVPKDHPRRTVSGTYSEQRPEVPAFNRSKTMPTQRPSSRRDAVPPKSSNLKHGETHDSGYGSGSHPPTPEMREESPPRRPKMPAQKPSTKYQIVDPNDSDDDRRTTIRVLDNDNDRRRFHRSPEHDHKESEKRREKERPRGDIRTKSSRDMPAETPKPRRSDSARETPPMSRHNSGRERDRFYGDISDEGEKPYRYKYPSGDKINVRPPYTDPQYSKYRDSPDRRNYDYSPGSRFSEGFNAGRRPSVPAAHG